MSSNKDKGQKGAKPEGEEPPALASQLAYGADRVVRDDTQFPVPELYFKVFDSEVDEPEGKIRRDVGKLYERWQKKYGRRWPENGMNTEDLVWLAEEAYKLPGASSQHTSAKALGLVPLEKDEYPGEFITEPADDHDAEGPAAGAGAKGAKPVGGKKTKPNISNYEATAAGGNWVTDEFESMDYEAGNMETLWGMYLWDREGKPTMMPDGPPDEAKVRKGASCAHAPACCMQLCYPAIAALHDRDGTTMQFLCVHARCFRARNLRSGTTSTAAIVRVMWTQTMPVRQCGPLMSSSPMRTTQRASGSLSTWAQVWVSMLRTHSTHSTPCATPTIHLHPSPANRSSGHRLCMMRAQREWY